jgi:arabinofuranosyltransferase
VEAAAGAGPAGFVNLPMRRFSQDLGGWRWSLGIGLAVAAAVLATAWISDDALITLRTAANLAEGHGFRWNPLDRTQTATHPLWILLLSAARWLSGELYYTTIALGVACSAVAAAGLASLLRSAADQPTGGRAIAGILLLAALLGSRSFIEFGTCGLENPLVHGLLAGFAWQWFRGAQDCAGLRRLALVSALLALARQDLVLLVAPCLLQRAFQLLRSTSLGTVLAACVPAVVTLAAWYGFALVYFGTIIPTPGYAKVLAADVPAMALLRQGANYLLDLAWRDPGTAMTLLIALAVAAWRRCAWSLWPGLGILLQILYTLRVGGDFMSGRFFTPALVLATALLVCTITGRAALLGSLVVAGAALLQGLPPWLQGTPSMAEFRLHHGIGNERAYYATQLGLWSAQRPAVAYGMLGAMFGPRQRPAVLLVHAAGIPAYLNGSHAHLVDPYLCDPLLVRLPLRDPGRWRIGHFQRRLPEGYLETLAQGRNRLHHPALRRYWDQLALVLQAPLWSAERWRAILFLHSAEAAALLQEFVTAEYRKPPCVERSAATLAADPPLGSHWFDATECVVVREGGVRITDLQPGAARRLRLCIDGHGQGEVRWRYRGQETGRQRWLLPPGPPGARWLEVALPEQPIDGFELLPEAPPAAADELPPVLDVLALLAVQLGGRQ